MLEPALAASLVVVCSVISQAQTFPAIARSIQPTRVLPFIVPGLLGVQIGTLSLLYLNARHLKVSVWSYSL